LITFVIVEITSAKIIYVVQKILILHRYFV